MGVVTNYSTMDFLPLLKHIVDDLLLQSGSHIQKRNAQSFLKIFHAFVICVKRLTSRKDPKEDEEHPEEIKNLGPAETVIRNFLGYYNAKKDSKLFENNEELENGLNEEDKVDDSKNDDDVNESTIYDTKEGVSYFL